jgi:hypothetical protein
MKILNDIACNSNWIQIWLDSNSIEEEWNANWYVRNWKFACNCGVDLTWESSKQIPTWNCPRSTHPQWIITQWNVGIWVVSHNWMDGQVDELMYG